MGYPTVKTPWS